MSRSVPKMGTKSEINIPHKKKKKTKYFDTYISKLLKERYPNFSMNGNSRDQINKLLITLCESIGYACFKSLKSNMKKTINIKNIKNILELYFKNKFLKDIIFNGEQCLENLKDFNTFQKNTNDKRSRYTRKNIRAMIIIPPSLVEKFLRIYKKILLSSEVSTFFAGCVEYILIEILDLAVNEVISQNKSRILIRHIEFGINKHEELKRLISILNITFIGGPVFPGIHSELTLKQEGSNKLKTCIKDIKMLQKSNKLIIPKIQIERIIRKVLFNDDTSLKVSKIVFISIQYIIERKILDILRKANIIALHTKKFKVNGSDISLVLFLEKSMNNFSLNDYYTFSEENHFDIKYRKKYRDSTSEVIPEDDGINDNDTIEDSIINDSVIDDDGTVLDDDN